MASSTLECRQSRQMQAGSREGRAAKERGPLFPTAVAYISLLCSLRRTATDLLPCAVRGSEQQAHRAAEQAEQAL